MTLLAKHLGNRRHRRAAPAQGPSDRLRAVARALRQWWAEDRHYRPERRYMRG
jgi:hypothetical protein